VESDKAALATARGPLNGTCVLVKSVGPVDSIPTQQAHWKFRPVGDQKLQLFSKSGGYTIKMDRTSPTKFYGSTIQGERVAVRVCDQDREGRCGWIRPSDRSDLSRHRSRWHRHGELLVSHACRRDWRSWRLNDDIDLGRSCSGCWRKWTKVAPVAHDGQSRVWDRPEVTAGASIYCPLASAD
jgi:hypothetical protein